VKRIIVSAAAVAVLAGVTSLAATVCSGFAATAWGQAQASRASSVPHKVGLIDMAEIFKKYKKFTALREDLKAEIAQSEQKAKRMANEISTGKKKLKQLDEGSPDYGKLEKQVIGLSSELQAFSKSAQREFLQKESQIYKTIYLEVTDAVQEYTKYYHYTLILRFSRQGLDKADKPTEVIQRMNQLVVDYRKEDDITDSILDYLNRKYGVATKTPTSSTRTSRGPSQGGTQRR